ncbi:MULTISPECIES: site-specific DNA-methyltransferase [Bacillus cereus group]|uniref:Site-specific DNA-methyltransferase n=1 Tax=Bacillus cereus TaxID=1396 RepID=A0A9W7UYW7_BACCE|nr:site-specific DNA-methyltransferase [Bacillus cereus]KAB2399538.1 site-specific DNA-methyltransferase [Bacillus cereus]KAB2400881.1 site-specific DNA-methyltransferase [Bacillus cereus]KAB2431312.1 site-specific DNA-methyltransferase [Bacillus cereus]
MPSLNWIGKDAVIKHHKEIPFHLLQQVDKYSFGDLSSNNLLINADNIMALKALLPHYAGKIKCIYIDPPYNTGNEHWVYNDNVNSKEITEWLGKVVGKELEDLSRHDKWLCMMYPRLLLAREFLTEDGIIFISIDDNEQPLLRIIMDEIFHAKNMLANFIWQTEGNFDNQAKVKICHEYILAYCKDISSFPAPPVIDPNIKDNSKLFKQYIRNTVVKNGPKNPVSEIALPAGFPAEFKSGVISKRDDVWPHYESDLIIEDYKLQVAVKAKSGWSSKKILQEFIDSDFEVVKDSKGQETKFVLTKTGAIEGIKKRSSSQSHVISVLREVGSTQQASAYLDSIGMKFDYPKPVGLIKYLLSMIGEKNFTVLDFFGGSGTTAQAVMELNHKDNGNRQYIVIEWDNNVCLNIAAKRLSNEINKANVEDSNLVNFEQKLGFKYLTLGPTLFNEHNLVNENVQFEQLARHIYYMETGNALSISLDNTPTSFLGVENGLGVYLLYNNENPVESLPLTIESLRSLPKYEGPKVVYGTTCKLSSTRLQQEQITFKQIPYEVKVK